MNDQSDKEQKFSSEKRKAIELENLKILLEELGEIPSYPKLSKVNTLLPRTPSYVMEDGWVTGISLFPIWRIPLRIGSFSRLKELNIRIKPPLEMETKGKLALFKVLIYRGYVVRWVTHATVRKILLDESIDLLYVEGKKPFSEEIIEIIRKIRERGFQEGLEGVDFPTFHNSARVEEYRCMADDELLWELKEVKKEIRKLKRTEDYKIGGGLNYKIITHHIEQVQRPLRPLVYILIERGIEFSVKEEDFFL